MKKGAGILKELYNSLVTEENKNKIEGIEGNDIFLPGGHQWWGRGRKGL